MIDKIINILKNKNIVILGFGKEGRSTYKFIRKYLDQHITIADIKDISHDELLIGDNNLSFKIGDDYLSNLDSFDLIIKSPGISFKDIDTNLIYDKITSQLELMLLINSRNIIGVTGTKGKSTTSSLIYEVLKNNNRDCYLLGNIGNPIFDDIEKYTDDTLLVIEMSSHQLEFINKSPHIGVILNLFEDHLDHAGSVEHYHECKLNMFKYMNENDIGIYCSDNYVLNNYVKIGNYLPSFISVSLDKKSDVYIDNDYVFYNGNKLYDINSKRTLIGMHNLENIMVVLLISKLLNLDLDKSIYAINNFKPLEHRLEYVGTYNDIIYYNDSIATIPQATINAINSLKCVDTLIFGGMDRGIDYSSLVDYLNNCDVENLICMPYTGYKIGKLIKNKNVYFIENLKDAVELAKKITLKKHICLLSPAAPSYEYFKDFTEKGRVYKEYVRND